MESYATKKLAWVIYDEAHYVLTHRDFHPQLLGLSKLISVQIVRLTATLAAQQLMFEELMCVKGSRYIRASTNIATTAYSVRCAEGLE
jgi:hypothetical protein